MKNIISKINAIINPHQVGYVIFYVTNRCNFRCNFCFYRDEIDKGLKPEELTVSDIEKMAKNIGPLIQLSLTGGEPFLRKEFLQIAEILIMNTSPLYVTVPTNGSLSERIYEFYEYLLPKYKETYFRLVLSIEGIGEEHDQLRDVKGSFEKIKKSFELLYPLKKKYKNLVIDSNSVFTTNSQDSLLNTVKYLKNNFDFDNISVTYARGKIPDERLKNVVKEKYVEINDYIEKLERNKEGRIFSSVWRGINAITRDNIIKVGFDNKFVNPCVAGKKIIVISETGDVHPCEILDEKLGNLKSENFDLKRILRSEKTKKLTKWIKDSKCKCTFECAASASVVWNPSNYFKIIKASKKSFFRDQK